MLGRYVVLFLACLFSILVQSTEATPTVWVQESTCSFLRLRWSGTRQEMAQFQSWMEQPHQIPATISWSAGGQTLQGSEEAFLWDFLSETNVEEGLEEIRATVSFQNSLTVTDGRYKMGISVPSSSPPSPPLQLQLPSFNVKGCKPDVVYIVASPHYNVDIDGHHTHEREHFIPSCQGHLRLFNIPQILFFGGVHSHFPLLAASSLLLLLVFVAIRRRIVSRQQRSIQQLPYQTFIEKSSLR